MVRTIPGAAPDSQAEGLGVPADLATLERLLLRLEESPTDAEACLEAAAELLRHGDDQDGLRLLDRAFRLSPLCILRLLRDARLAAVRGHPGVNALLRQLKIDYDRRAWTGYA